MVVVYHSERDGLRLVADVDTSGWQFDNMAVEDLLEYAYRWTQNIEGSWSLKIGEDGNPHVNPIGVGERGHRSTSVGDVLITGGKRWEVSSIGFREIVG